MVSNDTTEPSSGISKEVAPWKKKLFLEWALSFLSLDPRFKILKFFNKVAQEGTGSIWSGQRRTSLFTRISTVFNLASVFTVWRPCSHEAIRKMMEGKGVGKGLDIKGKSARRGKLSGYVPFMQIHTEADKRKIRGLSSHCKLRVFFSTEDARDKAEDMLKPVLAEMLEKVKKAENDLAEFDAMEVKYYKPCTIAQRRERATQILLIWRMKDPNITRLDDYKPKAFGIEVPEKLFWEGYVMRQSCSNKYDKAKSSQKQGRQHEMNFAEKLMDVLTAETAKNKEDAIKWKTCGKSFVVVNKDVFVKDVLKQNFKDHSNYYKFVGELRRIGFVEETTYDGIASFGHKYFQRDEMGLCVMIGTEHDTGRGSKPGSQDKNFDSLRKNQDHSPRTVLWNFDNFDDPGNPQPGNPLCPHNLLMAYEENGNVIPVVSDFDCFTVGTKRIDYNHRLDDFHLKLIDSLISNIKQIEGGLVPGRTFTEAWARVMKKDLETPKYGFGDRTSYCLMKGAIDMLAKSNGAVRHGAESFNYNFPQDMDSSYLVISDSFEGKLRWKEVPLHGLHLFLRQRADEGYTFALNPKWVLRDKGWDCIYKKLISNKSPWVKSSYDTWYPPKPREEMDRMIAAKNDKMKGSGQADAFSAKNECISFKIYPIFLKNSSAADTAPIVSFHLCDGAVTDFKSEKKSAIVIASHESCVPVCGGVLEAVFNSGGEKLQLDTINIEVQKELSDPLLGEVRCMVGDAKMVVSGTDENYGQLNVKHVIYAAGPSYGHAFAQSDRKDDLLQSAYRKSLDEAKKAGLEAVAFSLMSSGARTSTWDPERPLRIAVKTIHDYGEYARESGGYGSLEEIHLCAFAAKERKALESIADEYWREG